MSHSTNKISHPYLRLRHLWLSLLMLLVGTNSTLAQNVAKVDETEYETLQAAFNAATDGQTVTLLGHYNAANEAMAGGTRQFVINKSITFDGGGFTLTTKQYGIGIGKVNSDLSSNIDVTIKNITIKNTSKDARCIDTRGKIGSLTLDGVTLNTQGASGTTQPLTIGGNQSDEAIVSITNSTIQTNDAGTAYYAIITFNPVNMTISNSTLKGWACIYAKGVNSSAGSAGSTFTIDHSNIVSSNAYTGVSNAFAAFVMEDNDVTINVKNSDITINNTGDQKQAIAGYPDNNFSGTVTLDEGTTVNFAGPNDCTLAYNDANADVSIIGGTYNFDPTSYLKPGFKAVENNGIWTVEEIVYVAQIGTQKYETLEAAFAVVNDGEKITMLDDVTLSGNLELALEGKSVTLDLGAKTLNGRTNLKSGNLNVTNGTVNCEGGQPLNVYGSATEGAENYSVLTIANDVTVSGDYGVCMFGPTASSKAGYGAVVNIAGTLNGTKGTVFVSGNLGNNIAGDMNNLVNITGKVNGNSDAGVALNGNATVNVKSGAEITGNTGIAIKRGVLNVEEGATIHATGVENLTPGANNNGTEMTGAAISMTDTYNNYGAMAVNITGGTITSDNTVALFKEEGNYTNAATYTVSGGMFNSPVPEEFCAEGYIPTNLGDGKYSVKVGEYVAKIGDVKYETLQDALDAAEAEDIKNVVIDLLGDATLDITAWSGTKNPLSIGTVNTESITINGNGKKLTFNQKNGDWNNIATMNDDVTKLILNDMSITSSGHNDGPWNRHDINFNCAVELNNVTSDKALAFKNDATLKTVTVEETGDNYAIWIQPNGQNISIDGLTVNASNGRGIKIDDQYVETTAETVTMSIANATFNTTKKSAILVKSAANTVITAGEGIIIANVAADKDNLVWVDEDRAEEFYKVTVNNATIMPESKETDYVACLMNGEQRWGFYKGTSALSKAIDKVEDGYSIKLFQTTTEAVEVSKPLVITKNGYTADNVIAADGFVREETETEIVIREFNPVCAIGEVKYETLESAFAAANDGETITLLADCAGNGIKVPQGKYTTGLTVDFDGHTYTMDGEMVGSTGTETQAFQLLKDNKITFKGGTITSEKAKFLVQNYSDLTLEGMTLTLNNENYASAYTLSNNNGNIVIDGTTINANPAGSTAFDVCRYSSYASVSVTVKGASVINGDVEVDAGGGDPKDGLGLTVEGGTFNGNLRLTDGGATAITDTPDKASVTKNNNVDISAPTDFKWKDNGDGTSTLVPCVYVAQIGDVKYESLAEAVAAVPTDGTETTITMIADETVKGNSGVTIATTQNVKLDLNGKTVKLSVTESKGSQLITNRGTLTITDSSDGQTGKLTNEADESLAVGSWPTNNYVTNVITNSGTLNMEAGTVVNTANGSICYAIDNNSTSYDAILNVKGGTLTAVGTVIRQFCNSTTKQNVINMTGGLVTTGGYAAIWTQLPGSNPSSKKLATLNISGGEVTASSYAWYDYSYGDSFESVEYNITGGKLTGRVFSYALRDGIISGFISGGYFSPAPSSSYIKPAGYMFVPSEEVEGYYVLGLAEVDYSWTENGKEYHDYLPFNTPFKQNYLMDGETITLLQNITLTEDLTWNTEGDATFTLNLGEFKITKGNFSIKLVPGQRVNTDKTTSISIFTSAEEGYVVKSAKDENGKYYYTVEEAEVLYTAANGTVKYMLYSSSMVTSDGTYKLLKDVSTTARLAPGIMASNVTLDLNGHTLTSTATDCAILLSRAGSATSLKTFNLIDSSDDKGGMLKVNPDVNNGIQVSGKYNQVTIGEGVTVDGDCVALLGENQTLTVNGTINGGNDFAVATNGSSTKNTNITINEGAVLTSNVAAMYLPGNEGLTATVNGGTITGGTSGIEIRAGQLVVNGGNITSTATEYSYTPNGSGSTTKGAAIAVVQHNTKLPTTVTVNDGTLAGKNTIAVVDAQGNNLEDVTVKAKDELVAENTVIPEGFIWLSDGQGMSTLVAKAALDFVLKDSETYPSALEGFGNGNVDVPASKVTYQRTFSATQKGNKQAWYLPVDYTITGEEDAVFYKIDFIAAAKESTEVEDITKVYIFITKMKAGDKLHANRPYVIKPNSAGNYEFVSENVTLYKRTADSRMHLEKSTINYDFYGTYEPFTEAEEYQWLAMNRGLITWNGNNARLGSYRWYIKPSSKLNEDYDYTKIRIDIAGDEDVVGISTQVVDDSEIEGYYSLNGTKLAIPVQGTNIVKYKNGMTKKIFIK